jgi:MoaA/NifB/PqqE/SkfB family radical SAM enzyme
MIMWKARDVVRLLLGGDASVGAWRIVDVRASSGIRTTFARREKTVTIVFSPPGRQGFVATDAITVWMIGTPEGVEVARLVDDVARLVRERAPQIPRDRLIASLEDAARKLAPVAADSIDARPLRPAHVELRLNLACNQRCFFCNCDGFAPNVVPAGNEAIARAAQLGNGGATLVTITGGEPTLHHALVDVVRAARGGGVSAIGVQTNAVLLSEGDLAARLRDAGASELFVSLHSHQDDVSDAITGAAGTHVLTLRGIDAAIAAGLRVTVNFVINRMNVDEPPAYVRFVRDRFGGALDGRVFSFMAPVGAAKRNLGLIPRFSDALPPLRAALDDCLARGERVRVAGICGLPLCQLAGYEAICDEADNPSGVVLADDRVQPPACASCAHKSRCSGVWREYVTLHGDAELSPRGA